MTFTEIFEASMIALACVAIALRIASVWLGMGEG